MLTIVSRASEQPTITKNKTKQKPTATKKKYKQQVSSLFVILVKITTKLMFSST